MKRTFFLYNTFFTPQKKRKMEIRKITKNDNFFSKNVFFTKNKNVKNRKLSIFSSRLEWKNWKNPPPPSCNDVVCEKKLFGKMTIFPIIESGGRGDRWKFSNFFIPSVNGPSAWKNWKCDFIHFHQNLNFSNRFFQKNENLDLNNRLHTNLPQAGLKPTWGKVLATFRLWWLGRCTPLFYDQIMGFW